MDQTMLRVHSFESLGTYDGPGVRLVVFLQGCPFRCLYCANPDTISIEGGEKVSGEEIVRKAESQRPFFGKKGGVTFSGGEPTAQARALVPVVRELKERGIHVCLDSNGGIWNEDVEELLGLCDLVLLDIKQIDPLRHRQITGRDNAQTLRTADWLIENRKPFWLRYVLVPGLSDFEKDICALGEHFHRMEGRTQREHFRPLEEQALAGEAHNNAITGTNGRTRVVERTAACAPLGGSQREIELPRIAQGNNPAIRREDPERAIRREDPERAIRQGTRERPGTTQADTSSEAGRIIRRVELIPYHTLGKHKYAAMGWKYMLEDTPLNTPEQIDAAQAILEEYFDCVVRN